MPDNKVELLECPFCKEDDFDLIGLAEHIKLDCQEYTKAIMKAMPRRFS